VERVRLNVTVLEPCAGPKFVPVMETEVPTGPESGDRPEMAGATENCAPLLATPPTVTITLPVVAPLGAGTTMLVSLQLVGVAATPLNVTALDPCVAPKFVPEMVTETPTGPEAGDKLAMAGGIGKATSCMIH